MDASNEFTSKPSVTQEKDLFEFEHIDETANNQKDDSSWSIENTESISHEPNPTTSTQSDDTFDNVTSSQVPTTASIENTKTISQGHDTTTSSQSDDTFDNVTSSQVPTTVNSEHTESISQEPNSVTSIQSNSTFDNLTSSQVPTTANIENTETISQGHNPTTSIQSDNVTSSQELATANIEHNAIISEGHNSTTPIQSDKIFDNVTSSQVPTTASVDHTENISQDPNPATFVHSDYLFDNLTSSEGPTTANDNFFEDHNEWDNFPPTAEDILSDNSTNQQSESKSSYNMFAFEELSPLNVIIRKRQEEIAAKDAEENRQIEEIRQQAKSDLERWYNERHKQMEQKLQAMKTEENELHKKGLEKSTKESCDWSKVIRLLDFTDGKQLTKSKRDLTRMKSCIFNAKRIDDKKKLANGN